MVCEGDRIQFQGLEGAKELNGTYGTVVKRFKNGPAKGRWQVLSEQRNGKTVNAKEENLVVVGKSVGLESIGASTSSNGSKAGNTEAAGEPILVVPPLEDKWGITCIKESKLEECRAAIQGLESPEEIDKVIYLTMLNNVAEVEAMSFPTLFPFGSGYYGQDRPRSSTFEEYVHHLLFQFTGNAFNTPSWIVFVTPIVAAIRQVTGRPPKHTINEKDESALDQKDVELLKFLTENDPQRTFCLRYLEGDSSTIFLNTANLGRRGP